MSALARKLRPALVLGAALVSLAFSAGAAELRDVEVDLDDGRYHLTSQTWFDVEPDALYAILSDFSQFVHFTSVVVESRNLDPDELGRPGFYARMEGCVLLWCQTFEREGYVELDPLIEIIAVVNPERSDFIYSREVWTLEPVDGGTLMIYSFEMEPDFWVPPVIGPFYIQRSLRAGAERAINRIEALAFSEHLRKQAENTVDSH